MKDSHTKQHPYREGNKCRKKIFQKNASVEKYKKKYKGKEQKSGVSFPKEVCIDKKKKEGGESEHLFCFLKRNGRK